jgi:hypothetical protein
MNDQIKQLLDQAQELAREEVKNTPELAKYAPSYAIPGTEIHVGLRLSYEKFAELIVGKCIAQCEQFLDDPDFTIGAMRCAIQLNQYFGVEE